MSSGLSAKRRRLNESLSSLNKPFRSPLKASTNESAPSKQNDNAANQSNKPNELAGSIKATASTTPVSADAKTSKSTLAKTIAVRNQTAITNSRATDPAEAAARRALTALELQIRSVRNDIDSLKQAAQITDSNNDATLEDLTQRWRVAAQAAAEEVFDDVKQRVARMGGVKAWRESERSKYELSDGFDVFREEAKSDDADCEFDSDGEELPEEEQESRKAKKRKARMEMEKAADVEERAIEEADEPQDNAQVDDVEDDVSLFVFCN